MTTERLLKATAPGPLSVLHHKHPPSSARSHAGDTELFTPEGLSVGDTGWTWVPGARETSLSGTQRYSQEASQS